MQTDNTNNKENRIEEPISRKIKPFTRYRVWAKETERSTFYTIQLRQTLQNGDIFKYYQPVKFRKNEGVANGTDIIIKRAIENDRPNPKDEYGFIREYMILDYEIYTDAYKDYQNAKNEISNNEKKLELNETEVMEDSELFPF